MQCSTAPRFLNYTTDQVRRHQRLKIAEEIITLQPEGRVNAEARLLAGEVQLERGNFDNAGKAFKGVALLYDDPAITPRALDKAAVSFRQAGNTEEADRLSHELRERYPNYAGG